MNTRLLSALILVLLTSISFHSDSQTVSWAKKGSSQGFDNGNAIVTDDSGNVYVTGQIEYTCTFESIPLSSAGIHDIVVAKYNSDGTLLWIKKAGGAEGDIGLGIGIDAQHNVYIAGEVELTVNFGNNVSVTSAGGNDGFLAKYDANGNIQWAKAFGNSGASDKVRSLAVSKTGNCYITGNFSASIVFGSTTLSGYGGNDIFVAKFDKNGVPQWAKKAGGAGQDRGYGIALDSLENVYVAGEFVSPSTFRNTTLTNSGKMSSFVAKYSTNGSMLWVKAGGDCCDTTQANAIAVDAAGDVYITGYFAVRTKFSSTVLTSAGGTDIFTVKYNTNGTMLYAKRAGGVNEDIGYGVAVDLPNNKVYITGSVASAGTSSSGTVTYSFVGYKDVVICAYSAGSGSSKWAKTYGGPWRDIGSAISVSKGNIYITGLFNGTAYFGSYTLTSYPQSYWADFLTFKVVPPLTPSPLLADGEEENVYSARLTEEEHMLYQPAKVFPNPFRDEFVVELYSEADIRIFDINGSLIHGEHLMPGRVQTGSFLQPGIYFVELSDGTNKEVLRLVKMD